MIEKCSAEIYNVNWNVDTVTPAGTDCNKPTVVGSGTTASLAAPAAPPLAGMMNTITAHSEAAITLIHPLPNYRAPAPP